MVTSFRTAEDLDNALVQTDFADEGTLLHRGVEINNQVADGLISSEAVFANFGSMLSVVVLVTFVVDRPAVSSAGPEGDFIQGIAVAPTSMKDGSRETAVSDRILLRFPDSGGIRIFSLRRRTRLFVQIVCSFTRLPPFDDWRRMGYAWQMGNWVTLPHAVV